MFRVAVVSRFQNIEVKMNIVINFDFLLTNLVIFLNLYFIERLHYSIPQDAVPQIGLVAPATDIWLFWIF